MHIAFDARAAQDHFPGIGRYVVSLLDALAQEPTLTRITAFYIPDAPRRDDTLAHLQAHPTITLVPAPAIFAPQSQLTMRRLITQSGAALLHSPYYMAPFLSPVPMVVTIHDLIPMAQAKMVPQGLSEWLYPWLNRLAAWRAAHILADSPTAAADVQRLLGAPPSKVTMVPLAPAPHFRPAPPEAIAAVRARYALSDAPYLFHVGINKPHKNHARLIKAFAQTNPQSHGVRLVLAGPLDPRWPTPAQMAQDAEIGDFVQILGATPDTDFPPLYTGALAFVFPSLAEGFGLPLLEAMACGAPCATSNIAPLSEWAAEGAALLFDPHDVGAIQAALHQLIHEPTTRDQRHRESLARAAHFTWARTAQQVIAIYQAVLARP